MAYSVLVTGANRGLGLEFCKQYAKSGWQVLACSRAGSPALQALAKAHSNVQLHTLDMADFAQIDALASKVGDASVDVLINNAGVYPACKFGETDYTAWEKAFKINCMSTLKMAEAFGPHLARGEQRKLVALTSKMGSIDDNTSGGEYSYRSTKTALNMVIKSLSIDLKPYKISVAALHPGWVRTEMGGPNGLIDTQTSVTGLRQVIANLSLSNTGQFIAYDGKPINW